VNVFHVEVGAADAPALVLVHGFPTSSIDWVEVADLLSDRYRVCAMDFPGFGFSDKPLGWGYSLGRDAAVLEHYVADVLGLRSMILYAHDRGSSVALVHTTSGNSRVHLEHLFVTNANIYLPMSNLTQAQRLMLDADSAAALLATATPEQLAEGMGQQTYTPPRGPDDPEVQALVAIFSHGEGLKVLHETIQYLVERSQDEESWLRALAAMDVPTTFIWGVYDTVSPPRVVSYVWNAFMMRKPGRNSLYFVPDANHYLQNDQPGAVVETVLHALESPDDTPPGAIAPRLASPLLVDRSRREMARAANLLEDPGSAASGCREPAPIGVGSQPEVSCLLDCRRCRPRPVGVAAAREVGRPAARPAPTSTRRRRRSCRRRGRPRRLHRRLG
jgi:pimeloyl-ACP methyl ester carboxylesterase